MTGAAAQPETGPVLEGLSRGLSVLTAFASAGTDGLTVTELAARVGLPASTVRRVVTSLVQEGYLSADHGRLRPAARTLTLGWTDLAAQSLEELAQPIMDDLVAATGFAASLGLLHGPDVFFIARSEAAPSPRLRIRLGTRLPAQASAIGRVLLAEAPTGAGGFLAEHPLRRFTDHTITEPAAFERSVSEAHRQGFSLIDQELEIGLCSLAAVIRNRDGAAVAGLSLSSYSEQAAAGDLRERALTPLRQATARLSEAIADGAGSVVL